MGIISRMSCPHEENIPGLVISGVSDVSISSGRIMIYLLAIDPPLAFWKEILLVMFLGAVTGRIYYEVRNPGRRILLR